MMTASLRSSILFTRQESDRIAQLSTPHVRFRLKYRNDPLGFVRDCIAFRSNESIAPYQADILGRLYAERRVSVRGPHGLGKTAVAAWVVLWGILTSDDCKIPTTASAWRQLTKFLWPEVHKWAARLKWDVVGREPFRRDEFLTLSIKTGVASEAFALASNNADLIEGTHGKRVIYIYDEAKSIPPETWDATEGAFSSAGTDTGYEAFALSISTPGEPVGRFWEIQSRKPGYEDWWVRHVTLDEAIAADRISRIWAEQRKRQWGEESAAYQNRVLGEFATAERENIISLAWVELAIERWYAWQNDGFPGNLTTIGVDVGGGGEGGDKSVFALTYDSYKVRELRKHGLGDPNTATMEIVGRAAGLLRQDAVAIVDVIGIGAGVYHRLSELGKHARAFVASKGTNYKDRSGELGFANWRSAAWWITREMLDPVSGFGVCLPPDDELIGDLTAMRMKRITSTSRIQVEGKKEVRKRIRRSTDCGDAVIQALVGPLLCDEEDAENQREILYNPVQIGGRW